jgi:hypothetical protein
VQSSAENTVAANADDSHSHATSMLKLVRIYLASQQISAKEKCTATSGDMKPAIHGLQQHKVHVMLEVYREKTVY